MRIEIDISAANDPEAHRWLDRILNRVEDGWHVWDTTGRTAPDAIEASAWIRDRGRQGKRVREMLVTSTQRSAWTLAPHGRRLRVTTRPIERDEFEPSGVDALEPEDAFRLSDEPLVIFVENRLSDGAFVRRIVTELCKSLHKLWGRRGSRSDSTAWAVLDKWRKRSSGAYRASGIVPGWSPSATATAGDRTIRKATRLGSCIEHAMIEGCLLGPRETGSGELSAPNPPC